MGLMFVVWASVQATPAWNLRVLPFWYLCVFLMMAAGVAELVAASPGSRGGAQARRLAGHADEERLEGVPRGGGARARVVGIGTVVAAHRAAQRRVADQHRCVEGLPA